MAMATKPLLPINLHTEYEKWRFPLFLPAVTNAAQVFKELVPGGSGQLVMLTRADGDGDADADEAAAADLDGDEDEVATDTEEQDENDGSDMEEESEEGTDSERGGGGKGRKKGKGKAKGKGGGGGSSGSAKKGGKGGKKAKARVPAVSISQYTGECNRQSQFAHEEGTWAEDHMMNSPAL